MYKKKTEAAKKDYLKALAAYRASLVSKVCGHHHILNIYKSNHIYIFIQRGTIRLFYRWGGGDTVYKKNPNLSAPPPGAFGTEMKKYTRVFRRQ